MCLVVESVCWCIELSLSLFLSLYLFSLWYVAMSLLGESSYHLVTQKLALRDIYLTCGPLACSSNVDYMDCRSHRN